MSNELEYWQDFPGFWFLLQKLAPLCLGKAGGYKAVAYQNGTLYQHSVGCQQTQLLFLGHGGKLILQIHGFVQQTAGVEKLFQGQAAAAVPLLQFFVAGVIFLDMALRIGNIPAVQPFLCLLAGGAGRVLNQ
jgi:hypothetical protein